MGRKYIHPNSELAQCRERSMTDNLNIISDKFSRAKFTEINSKTEEAIFAQFDVKNRCYTALDVIKGHAPQTVGPHSIFQVALDVYENSVRKVRRNPEVWRIINFDRLAVMASMINSNRKQYDFRLEQGILNDCEELTRQRMTEDPMQFNLSVVRNSIDCARDCNIAAIIYFMQTIFSINPVVLPCIDLTCVVDAVYEYAYDSIRRYPECVYDALEYAVADALDELQKQLPKKIEEKLLPLLICLAKNCKLSTCSMMRLLGVNSRQHLMETLLHPALEKCLIECTEDSVNSPKQKYRLTVLGRQQLLA